MRRMRCDVERHRTGRAVLRSGIPGIEAWAISRGRSAERMSNFSAYEDIVYDQLRAYSTMTIQHVFVATPVAGSSFFVPRKCLVGLKAGYDCVKSHHSRFVLCSTKQSPFKVLSMCAYLHSQFSCVFEYSKPCYLHRTVLPAEKVYISIIAFSSLRIVLVAQQHGTSKSLLPILYRRKCPNPAKESFKNFASDTRVSQTVIRHKQLELGGE